MVLIPHGQTERKKETAGTPKTCLYQVFLIISMKKNDVVHQKHHQEYIYIIHSALENISPYFVWYGNTPKIHELRTFGCVLFTWCMYIPARQ